MSPYESEVQSGEESEGVVIEKWEMGNTLPIVMQARLPKKIVQHDFTNLLLTCCLQYL